MAEPPIRVLVVDDHEVVRAGISAMLRREPDMHVVGTAGSGEEALEVLDEVAPQVIILDQRLPGMTGAATCEKIVRLRPSISVLILSSFLADDPIHACLMAGARGYLSKDIASSDLPRSVRAVARGETVLSPEVTARVIDWARRAKIAHQGGEALAPHEIEILTMVARGFSNRDIGKQLCKSEATVKLHLQSAMRKLGATRRWEAVAAGMERGVI